MKMPKNINMFCKKCGKHREHRVETVKKHKQRAKSQGQRRFKRKLKGYGSFPKPMPSGKKPTQRHDLRYKCSECGRSSIRRRAPKAKKFELVEK